MTGKLLDDVKDIGFKYATISGLTISLSDLETPQESLPLSMRPKRERRKLRNVLIVKNSTLKNEKRLKSIFGLMQPRSQMS